MLRKALTYGAGLIAIYLVVANSTGTKNVLTSGSSGLVNLTKALQGRG